MSLSVSQDLTVLCNLMAQPGSPQATRYFILFQVLPVDFMQRGQQTLRLTALLTSTFQLMTSSKNWGPALPNSNAPWCAIMLIQWKSKEEYWAPWLSKEIKCKNVHRRQWNNCLVHSLSLHYMHRIVGGPDSKFHSWVFSPNRSWISKCESLSPTSEISKVWRFNPNVSMHLFHLNTGLEFGTIESAWNSYMGKLMAPWLNKLPASLLEFGIATRQCNHALPGTSSHFPWFQSY